MIAGITNPFGSIQNREINLPILGSVSIITAGIVGIVGLILIPKMLGKKSSKTTTKITKVNFRK